MASARDIALIAVIVFAASVGFLATHYAANQALDGLINNTVVNESQQAVSVFQATKTLSGRFDYVIFGLFIGLCLALIITGWFVGSHPLFMFVYSIFIVITVALSAILSNTWETVSGTVLSSSVSAFPIATNLLSYLPYYMTGVGFIGMVVMFAKPFASNN